MSVRAGFAQVDITPPVGIHKIGWIKDIVSESVLDPLFARAAVLESADERIAFIQFDTLGIRRTQVADIRRRIEQRYGFPGRNIMVAATHNHAGPAVADAGEVRRDDSYVEAMVTRVVEMFVRALDNLQAAEIGVASAYEWEVGHNRRVVMRDGTVKTHGRFPDEPGRAVYRGADRPRGGGAGGARQARGAAWDDGQLRLPPRSSRSWNRPLRWFPRRAGEGDEVLRLPGYVVP